MKIANNLPKKLEIQEQLGYLSNLKTAIKDSLVSSINWLYGTIMNKLGETDISSIGDGTVTGAIQSLDSDKADNSLVGNDELSTKASTLTGAVNEINNNLAQFVKNVHISFPQSTISANAYALVKHQYSVPSGYKLRNVTINHSGAYTVIPFGTSWNRETGDTEILLYLCNTSSANISVTPAITIQISK